MIWIGWVATGLLVTGTVTTGLFAVSAADDLEHERASYSEDPSAKRDAIDSAADRTERLGLATDLLGAATLVVGGLTLYATFSSDDEPSADVELRAAPGGVQVAGSF